MVSLKSLQTPFSTIEKLFTPVTDFIRGNPLISTATVGMGSALVGAGITKLVTRKKKKNVKSKIKVHKRTKKRTKKKRRRVRPIRKKRIKRGGRRTPRTAGKGKDRSTKRIRYTKKGQPYVITRSGKAKFIKKSSAKRSHRMKGGRY